MRNYNNGSGLIANEIERDYSILFSNITVTNGYLNDENPFLESNGYSIAEDYDNIYSYCPRRMAKEMNKLGYSGIVDLYIGASHFYCKNGQANQLITNYKDMTLDSDKGINSTFKSWLSSYCKNLKENNVNEIVISVSLENLQMPESWKQRLFNGIAGQTGWQPPTCFYSLTNEDVRAYIEKISTECLNIVDEQGLNKIFQFGEPWWWAQAFAPGNVSAVNTAQPLAIYDQSTQNKFKIDNGFDMPIYETSTFKMNNESNIVASWLNLQLQDYSNFMKDIALKNGAEFAVLYYPPSTLSDTVPEFVKKVNTPFNAWNDNQLNYLQLEDYGWVTGENPQHQEVYTFGQDVLGYSTNRQQYFAGFVDDPSKADVEWSLIWEAAKEAKEKGFANVFIWSGTQVR
ncbi:MAG: non-contractile tail sheath protein [Sarcina sp.]